MQLRYCLLISAATLLLACKPAAHATPADISASLPASERMESGVRALQEGRRSALRGLTRDYLYCKDRAQGVIENAECIMAEESRQDARLNANYKKLLALLDESRKARLVQAQREWLVLKEKDGAFEASLFESSQIENLASAEREMLYVCERANRIEDWIKLVMAD